MRNESGNTNGICSRGESRFQIALTADFFDETGEPRYADFGRDLLGAQPDVAVSRFDVHKHEIGPEQLAGIDAVLVLAPRVTAASLEQADDLLVVARFGVGYDRVDVAACTERGVAVTIARGAVDYPVAEATLAWILALAYQVRTKDRLVREARWAEHCRYMGVDLRDRRVGIVGFGGIGRALARLLMGLGLPAPLVYDPHLAAPTIAAHGGTPVSLDRLLCEADFVTLHCPLTSETRGLLGRRELSLMKPTAFLINTARGGIVDESALYDALRQRQISGAAIDCFVGEPLREAPRFAELDNVILAPHSIAYTDRLFRDTGCTAIGSIHGLLQGRVPDSVVNPEVFDRPDFQTKWRRWRY